MANRVVVMLNGVRYPLRTVEEPAYVTALANEMDETLRRLVGESSLSLTEALILIGLEYLDNCKKADGTLDNMRRQVADYMEAVKRAEQELSDTKEKLRKLEASGSAGEPAVSTGRA